jgi:Tfp pilus assembly protein PilN
MSAHKKESQINLLPEKGFEQTVTGRVLSWVLSSFRIIVIITEIIVMTAFLSRFWLDAQNTDLTEELEQKQAVLAASNEFDKEFKDTQKRLAAYSELTEKQQFVTNSLGALGSYLPDDIFLTIISYSENTQLIEGLSPSERSIQQFIVNLESTGIFEGVTLTELKSDQNNSALLKFSINAAEK